MRYILNIKTPYAASRKSNAPYRLDQHNTTKAVMQKTKKNTQNKQKHTKTDNMQNIQ
jgi:hypothetical protein